MILGFTIFAVLGLVAALARGAFTKPGAERAKSAAVSALEGQIQVISKRLRKEMLLRRFYLRQAQSAEESLTRVRREHRADTERYEQRVDDLLRQVQSMAERIASLRLSGLPEGGGDAFVPTARERGYSDDLTRFLAALESEESRRVVEEQIEQLRSQSMDDEQIYEIVREGAA